VELCVLLETLIVILLLLAGTIRDSSVSRVTRLPDEPKKKNNGNLVSIPEKLKYFALLDASIMALWSIQLPIHQVTGVIIRRLEEHVGEDVH